MKEATHFSSQFVTLCLPLDVLAAVAL